MINIKIPILGVDNTVTRYVAVSVANDLKNMFSLDPDLYTALSNFVEHYNDQDATIGDGAKDNFLPTLNKPYDMKITFEEKVNEDAIITTDTNNPSVVPVFYDPDLDLTIKPIYVDAELTLNIKYFTKSKSQANSILNNLKIRTAENAEMQLHNIEYFFYLSKGIGKLLIDVLDKKNIIYDNEDDKVSFEDYLINHTGKRLNAANSYIGLSNKIDLVVKEKQKQVVGYFNMDLVNQEKEYNDDRNGYEVNITYTVNYNKPIYIYIKYPIMIYNQLLDKSYVQRLNISADKIDISDYVVGYSDAYKYVKTEYLINKWYRNWHYVSIPYYDLHQLPEPHPYMLRLFVVLLQISKDDKRSLFNLKEIPGYKLHDDILNYIKECKNDIFRVPYSGAFHFVLYEDKGIVDPNIIEIDDDLNIYTTADLDITKTYRMAMNVIVDWTMLNDNAKKRIAKYPNVDNRVYEFLSLDRNNYRFTDDSIISVPQPEIKNYIAGLHHTHIEAFLADDIYEKDDNRTIFDTKE